MFLPSSCVSLLCTYFLLPNRGLLGCDSGFLQAWTLFVAFLLFFFPLSLSPLFSRALSGCANSARCVCVLPSVARSLFLTQFTGGTAAVHLAVLTKLWCSAGRDTGRSILYLQIFDSSHTQTLLNNSFELTLRLSVPSFPSSGNRVN